MSYLKSVGTSFIYIAFFLSVITFSPGLPPVAQFDSYSIKPPAELVGVLAPNERLNDPEILFRGEIKGPESFDSYNGELYTGLHGGNVGKIVGDKIIPVTKFGVKCAGIWEEQNCGRPLGLKFDKQGRLYVADAYYGIFKVDVKTGEHEKLFAVSRPINGKVPHIINSLDVASNGDVYWTESSTDFKLYDGVFIMLANPTGRLVRYNAATKKNEVLLENLAFANGLKLSEDESYLIVAETISSVLTKYHLKGPKAGKRETLLEALPGLPDNIHADGQGNFLVGIVSPADPQHPQLMQTLIPHPYIRKMLSRLLGLAELPFKLLDDVYPSDFAKRIIHAIGSFETTTILSLGKVTVLRINGDGKIIDALHNSDEKVGHISSAFVHDDYLWLGSPFNDFVARVPLKKAFPNVVFARRAREEPRIVREAVKIEKPVAAAPKPEKIVAEKVVTKPAVAPKPTEAPRAPKVEKKPRETEKQPETRTKAPVKAETDKAPVKEIPVRENVTPKPTKQTAQEKPERKAEKPRKTSEVPPKQTETGQNVKKDERKIADEPPRQQQKVGNAEKVMKQQQTAKKLPEATAKKVEQGKRSTKISDEV